MGTTVCESECMYVLDLFGQEGQKDTTNILPPPALLQGGIVDAAMPAKTPRIIIQQ